MSYQVRNAKRARTHTADTPHWQIHRDTERGPCLRQQHADLPFSTVETLQAFCDVNNRELQWANEFGEPGYSNPEKGILFADWNDIPKSLQDRLETQGYELEWQDEWYVDTSSSPCKAWRTQGDSMSWEPQLRAVDGDYLTPDSDPQEWIDSSLNEQDEPLCSWFKDEELQSRGYRLSNTGHDPGNRLRNVFAEFRAKGYDVILKAGYRSFQYDVWSRKEATEETAGAEFCEADDTYYVSEE